MKGYYKHSIVYDPKTWKWIIIDKQLQTEEPYNTSFSNYTILAEYSPVKSMSKLPTGLHTWTLFDVKCNGTRKLKLSAVCLSIA